MRSRTKLRAESIAADIVALALANAAAIWIHAHLYIAGSGQYIFEFDWSLVVFTLVVVAAFFFSGLYEREVYVSRPLHLWTMVRASVLSLFIAAVAVYLLKSHQVDQSRLTLFLTFALFLPIVSVLRIGLLDSIATARMRRKGSLALLVGGSRESVALAARLKDLRGFSHLTVIASPDEMASASAGVHDWLEDRSLHEDPMRAVFIDSASVSPRHVLDMSRMAGNHGADVYVLSGLLGPLEGSRVLHALFHAPVIRVRRRLETAWSNTLKRTFDLVGSAILLVLAAPVVAVLAVIIKLTSPGPVFYTQTRIGRFGQPFEFYKFRSMVVNDDASEHESYVKAFMAGEAEAVRTEDGEAVFKTIADPRITPVGRFIRKYSLDEIPQFWNTLRGDMSLVGPRPPLQYEVDQYDEWARMRLRVQPGVTGMWQVAGRSRVSFDEMILQDLMYAQNGRLCVDVGLCLLTVPAAVIGYGGG